MTRAFAVTVGRPASEDLPSGPAQIVETSRLGIALYLAAGILVIQSRRPRTGAVILDMSDLSEEALEVLRAFAGDR